MLYISDWGTFLTITLKYFCVSQYSPSPNFEKMEINIYEIANQEMFLITQKKKTFLFNLRLFTLVIDRCYSTGPLLQILATPMSPFLYLFDWVFRFIHDWQTYCLVDSSMRSIGKAFCIISMQCTVLLVVVWYG